MDAVKEAVGVGEERDGTRLTPTISNALKPAHKKKTKH